MTTETETELQEQAEETRPWFVAGEGSGAEVTTMAKMGCPEATGARGGGGTAGEALWRRGDRTRRPTVEAKWCRRHRGSWGGISGSMSSHGEIGRAS